MEKFLLLVISACLLFTFKYNSEYHYTSPAPSSANTLPIWTCDPIQDSMALVALYNATDGANWTNKWELDQPFSTWYGITLGAEGCVTEINLVNNNLNGPLPPELGDLTNLHRLNIWLNDLGGTIPPELGQLSQLEYLRFSNSLLTGGIPAELGALSKLTYLDLSINELSDTIPQELGQLTLLVDLRLDYNEITGRIPASIGSLSRLQRLKCRSNNLTGPLPPDLGNLGQLRTLDFGYNDLTGTIPATLGNLQRLGTLNIDGNQLTGTLPTELGNLGNLSNLSLARNELEGPIPASFGNLTSLTNLWLFDNQLTGSIPASIGNLPNLGVLQLNSNQLTGPIPPELGNMPKLALLLLNDNQLNGTIPARLSLAPKLYRITLDSNQLEGPIPVALAEKENLRYLLLSDNLLTGTIPAALGALPELRHLELHNNQLSGCFPLGLMPLCELGFSEGQYLRGYNFTGNPDLPGGGDFDAFCNTGTGAATSTGVCSVCTQLVSPTDGAADVEITTDLSWAAAGSNPLGYLLRMGTSSGGMDIVNSQDVGNVTTYNPGTLPANTTIYVTIQPYYTHGVSEYCMEESFSTLAIHSCNVPEHTVLNDIVIEEGDYRAAATITSNGLVTAPAEVTFSAGQSISLQAGFRVEAGSVFRAGIEDCIPSPPPATTAEWVVSQEVIAPPSPISLKVYPNPFRQSTILSYELDKRTEVTLLVHDLSGRLWAVLLRDAVQEKGEHQLRLPTHDWPAGIYNVSFRTWDARSDTRIVVME